MSFTHILNYHSLRESTKITKHHWNVCDSFMKAHFSVSRDKGCFVYAGKSRENVREKMWFVDKENMNERENHTIEERLENS